MSAIARLLVAASAVLALLAQALPAGALLLCVHPDGEVALEMFGDACCAGAPNAAGRSDSFEASGDDCAGCTDTDLGAAPFGAFDRASGRASTVVSPSAAGALDKPPGSPGDLLRIGAAAARPDPLAARAPAIPARLAGAAPLRI